MSIFESPDEAKAAGVTYHLVPVPVWDTAREEAWYTPEAYEADGFIHCTDGTDLLVQVANRYYTDDNREFVALALDVPRIESEIKYDDPDEQYPHIYGPLNLDAVIAVLPVQRDKDGSFTGIGQVA